MEDGREGSRREGRRRWAQLGISLRKSGGRDAVADRRSQDVVGGARDCGLRVVADYGWWVGDSFVSKVVVESTSCLTMDSQSRRVPSTACT